MSGAVFPAGLARRVGVAGVVAAVFAAAAAVPARVVSAQAGGFADVPGDSYYSDAVSDLAAAGVFEGTECEGGGFCPDGVVYRKTMAVWVVRVLDEGDPPAAPGTRFSDVDGGSFHAGFIERMADLKVTRGCGSGSGFCPDGSVTRAQMAVFLTRAFSLPDGDSPEFSDIDDDAWYRREVAALAASGVTQGCGDGGGFCPDEPTTRAQIAAFLHRAMRATASRPVPVVSIPDGGGAVTVPRGSSLTARVAAVTVEAPVGAFTDDARVSLSETQVGVGRTAEGEQLAAAPVAVSVTGAEIARPVTLRFEVDTTALDVSNAVPAWYSSDLDDWVPLDIESLAVGGGEVTATAVLEDAVPAALSAADERVSLLASAAVGAHHAGSAAPAGPVLALPLVAVAIGLIVVFGGAVAIVSLSNDTVHDVLKEVFGLYTREPRCAGGLPPWVASLRGSDAGEPSLKRRRLHVCGEAASGGELQVTAANNRNYGVVLETPPGRSRVDMPGGSNPAGLIDSVIKEAAEMLIGGAYLWPLSTSSFTIPEQQARWQATGKATAWTMTADGLRVLLDLLKIAYPPIAVIDDALSLQPRDIFNLSGLSECLGDAVAVFTKKPRSLKPTGISITNYADWKNILTTVRSCLKDKTRIFTSTAIKKAQKSKHAEKIGAALKETRRAIGKYLNSAEAGAKWGVTFADFIKDADRSPATITITPTTRPGTGPGTRPGTGPGTRPGTGPGRYTAITAGNEHTCAIRTDKTIACWGWNELGQADPPAGGHTAISAGAEHTCAIRTDKTIACWGSNEYGQTAAPTGGHTAISAGAEHTCAIRTDRTIACWGSNEYGQTDPPAGEYSAVSDANGHHACALRADKTIACWGWNEYGQTDPPAGEYTAISAGGAHTCALRTDKTITCWGGRARPGRPDAGLTDAPAGEYTAISAGVCATRTDKTIACWGRNNRGLTHGLQDEYTSITGEVTTNIFTAVAVGGAHACAIRTDKTIACWGRNHKGQGTPPTGEYTAVAAGKNHTCAIRADRTILCRGYNYWGQTDAPKGEYTAITTVWDHTCAIRADKTIKCWGWNRYGQTDAPAGHYTAVSAGADHTCAIRTDRAIACWGNNAQGQADPPAGEYTAIGGTCAIRTDRAIACWGSTPYEIEGEYSDISPGDCAITIWRTINCWGLNNRESPRGEFTAISSGNCAITIEGTVNCWGLNNRESPTGEFTAISVGGHACAIRTDRTVTCWGPNTYGQRDIP